MTFWRHPTFPPRLGKAPKVTSSSIKLPLLRGQVAWDCNENRLKKGDDYKQTKVMVWVVQGQARDTWE